MRLAGTRISSAIPPAPVDPNTLSPTLNDVTPSPTAFTTPEISPPGENGRCGLYWYMSWMIRKSGKFTPTAFTDTTISPLPGVGEGTSSSTSVSGRPGALERIARMLVSPSVVSAGWISGPVRPCHPVRGAAKRALHEAPVVVNFGRHLRPLINRPVPETLRLIKPVG